MTEVPAVRTLLARAFAEDPMFSWVFPEASGRTEALAVFMGLLVEAYEAAGQVDVVAADDGSPAAVALWRVVESVEPPPAAVTLPTVGGYLSAVVGPDHAAAVGAGLAETREHRPEGTHAYLNALGAAPERRGQGYGAAAVRRVTDHADAARIPTHLDTVSPDNVEWYARRGFDVVARYRLGDGPPAWAMTRPPHPG
ncbi:acetyltransferase (GNAT) family protein [Isoptericola sp. CG 20/1183]|uniref:Acetyltransferase (GNAT) family protein n=1 Tax=Isoptericola halotolerans TaxID=300560 RepID=A0ABX5EF03_9MICO|nr:MULTISPECIES: GNAT family N-acetyltransferase [Isoptericola]PRZ04396.1 acetyltransferase (GNAT) family protein [Isoptericola halotolerans]PRZ04706.1 acetyltransferase (GNAT) family protein [Isoptericola sp. CG 20/1183]